MDAYSPAAWEAVFSALASASAALTGLLFVALSINLGQVIKGAGLVARAIEVLILLISVLAISILLLIPAQPASAAGSEVLSIGVVAEVALTYIHVRAPRQSLHVSVRGFAMRVLGAQVGPLLMIAGAVSLLFGAGGGLYWVVPALLFAAVAAIIGAWGLLVEIVR